YPADIRNAALDIAVCSGPENDEGETLGIEETVWACKRDMRVSGRDPVPLAVLDRSCWWRDLPAAALDAIGREYEVAFRSSSFSSIQSAIRSGFAVGILPETCVTDEVTVLSRNDGFPELPRSRRSIMVAAGAPKALTAAMADAIRTARSEALEAQKA
ncbi:MAG: LysR substrate-binding domain-containing protein, partial [Pseudomonadota bacterium]